MGKAGTPPYTLVINEDERWRFRSLVRSRAIDFYKTAERIEFWSLTDREDNDLGSTYWGDWPKYLTGDVERAAADFDQVVDDLNFRDGERLALIFVIEAEAYLEGKCPFTERLLPDIRNRLRKNRRAGPQIWRVALIRNIPGDSSAAREVARSLTKGSDTDIGLVENIFFVACATAAQEESNAADPLNFAGLRTLIDLVRDFENGWEGVRWTQQSKLPRCLRYISPNNEPTTRGTALAQILTRTVRAFDDRDDQNTVDDQIERLQTKVNEFSAALGLERDDGSIKTLAPRSDVGTPYRTEHDTAAPDLKELRASFYEDRLFERIEKKVGQELNKIDQGYRAKLTEFQELQREEQDRIYGKEKEVQRAIEEIYGVGISATGANQQLLRQMADRVQSQHDSYRERASKAFETFEARLTDEAKDLRRRLKASRPNPPGADDRQLTRYFHHQDLVVHEKKARAMDAARALPTKAYFGLAIVVAALVLLVPFVLYAAASLGGRAVDLLSGLPIGAGVYFLLTYLLLVGTAALALRLSQRNYRAKLKALSEALAGLQSNVSEVFTIAKNYMRLAFGAGQMARLAKALRSMDKDIRNAWLFRAQFGGTIAAALPRGQLELSKELEVLDAKQRAIREEVLETKRRVDWIKALLNMDLELPTRPVKFSASTGSETTIQRGTTFGAAEITFELVEMSEVEEQPTA